MPEQVFGPHAHRLRTHPADRCLKIATRRRGCFDTCDQVAARNVDILGECESHRLRREGGLLIAIKSHDARYPCLPSRGQYNHRVANMDPAGGDPAHVTAEIAEFRKRWTIHKLDRE